MRAQRLERDRRLAVEAAIRLFETKGYDATTVEEIAAAALLSPRTFYRHFKSKDGIFFHDHAVVIEAFASGLRGGGDPVETLRRATAAAAAAIEAHAGMWRRRLRLIEAVPALRARDAQMADELVEQVARFLAKGRSRRRASILAGAVVGAVEQALGGWRAGRVAPLLDEAVLAVAPLLRSGTT